MIFAEENEGTPFGNRESSGLADCRTSSTTEWLTSPSFCHSTVAFLTLMTSGQPTEATIGPMRQMPDAPPYSMEFLITHLALELKARQFSVVSPSSVPLAGLACTPLSSQWHRVGGLLRRHAGSVYNFQGLRSFKQISAK